MVAIIFVVVNAWNLLNGIGTWIGTECFGQMKPK
jgi:hypothetical protein